MSDVVNSTEKKTSDSRHFRGYSNKQVIKYPIGSMVNLFTYHHGVIRCGEVITKEHLDGRDRAIEKGLDTLNNMALYFGLEKVFTHNLHFEEHHKGPGSYARVFISDITETQKDEVLKNAPKIIEDYRHQIYSDAFLYTCIEAVIRIMLPDIGMDAYKTKFSVDHIIADVNIIITGTNSVLKILIGRGGSNIMNIAKVLNAKITCVKTTKGDKYE
jgi:hypothetical protein